VGAATKDESERKRPISAGLRRADDDDVVFVSPSNGTLLDLLIPINHSHLGAFLGLSLEPYSKENRGEFLFPERHLPQPIDGTVLEYVFDNRHGEPRTWLDT
jgi:hypothetical protein